MDRRLLWLAVGAFATSTMAFVFAGLLPLVAAATHVTISEAGRLVMAYSLAYAIGTPILATLTGTADRKRVILGALVLFVAGNVMAATSNSFALLTAAQIVMGMAAGLFAATAQATAVMLAGPEHRAKAVAAVVGGTTFAVALGAPLGSLIGNLAGWRATFLFVGLLAVLCAIVLALMLPRGLPGVKLTLAERMLTITRPNILPSLAVTFLYLTGGFVILCYLAPLATEGAGLPVTVLPGMLLAFGVGAVAGNYASGQLADRLGPTRVVVLALLLSSAICIALTLIAGAAACRARRTAADRHHGAVGVRRLDVPAGPGEPHRRPCARARQFVAAAQRLGHVFRHRLRLVRRRTGAALSRRRPSLASSRLPFRWWRWSSCLPTRAGAPSASRPNDRERLSAPAR